MLSIADIKMILNNESEKVSSEQLAEFRLDTRKGVQKLLKAYDVKQKKIAVQKDHFEQAKQFEIPLWNDHKMVAGIDEVGRGPLAGPVLSAAVILPTDVNIYGINDSKKLSANRREKLFFDICDQAIDIGVGIASPSEIDQYNIYEATRIAMKRAVEALIVRPQHLLVDAMNVPVEIKQTKIIKGDFKSISIGASSIVAKVIRDNIMETYGEKYPGYGFENNAGYGTAQHLEGLKKFGVTDIHRKTFAPVNEY